MAAQAPLNPLIMVMAINDDTRFTPAERVALIRAVKHTDNASRQIRMSQVGIAGSVGISRDTVKRAFAKAYASGYFSERQQRRNEHGHKVTDYWFSALPIQGAGEDMDEEEPKVQAKVQEKSPSTSSTTTPSSDPSAMEYPCFEHGVVGCICPQMTDVEVCQQHASFSRAACPFQHEPRQSSLTPKKERELYERNMTENDPGDDPSGEALGSRGGSSRYSGRNRQ